MDRWLHWPEMATSTDPAAKASPRARSGLLPLLKP
jgi:hypothetical protein